MNTDFTLEERLVQARIFLMRNSPFFATLLLNSQVTITEAIPTAATDGFNLMINPEFMASLSDSEFTAVLCHEVLHMAFAHNQRYAELPDPPKPELKRFIFNYAADIIVNGVVALVPGLSLPDGAVREESLEDKGLPEVYNELLKDIPDNIETINVCMQGGAPDTSGDDSSNGSGDGDDDTQGGQDNQSGGSKMSQKESEDYWKEVLERAKMSEQMGRSTSSILAKIDNILAESTIDWKTALSQWIVPTTFSWGGYDRRFIHDEFYIDTNETDGLNLRVFIDTSGSVCEKTLASFIGEIKDNLALSNWAHVNIEGYFFDTRLYGPHDNLDALLTPQGFGGTDFDPIIDLIKNQQSYGTEVNIIFTDGYATIPKADIKNVIWILGSADGQTKPVMDFVRAGWEHIYKYK